MERKPIKKRSQPRPKKRKKAALGRGLDALLPDIGVIEEDSKEFFLCNMELIRPGRYQPRIRFSKEELDALSRSIQENGVIQPILVRKIDNGYEIIAGERRFRAAKLAKLAKIPVIVKDIEENRMLVTSIVENIQREDLNTLEEAEAYHRLMQELHLTQAQVSARVGKSRSAIANFLRLRQLPKEIKAQIMDRALSSGHARALLGVETPAAQIHLCRMIIQKGLSVRETENLIQKLKSRKKTSKKAGNRFIPYFSDLADDLSRHFGTRVEIKKHGKKGKVEIEFYSDDDLDRLISLLKQK